MHSKCRVYMFFVEKERFNIYIMFKFLNIMIINIL